MKPDSHRVIVLYKAEEAIERIRKEYRESIEKMRETP